MIRFWDQTLRDGEQSPGVYFTPSEKVRLAVELEKTGIFRAEVGFPIVSRQEQIAIRRIVELGLRMKIVCPARCKKTDIDAVAETGAKEIAIFISTSPELMRHSLRTTPSKVLRLIVDSIEYAIERGLYVHAVSEDTTRSKIHFVETFLKEAVRAGAKGIVITDTLGIARPSQVSKLAAHIRQSVRADSYSIHAHNDLGLATANTLSAVQVGFDSPQTTINGIGERSGNASFDEVAMALKLLYHKQTGIRYHRIYEMARLVEKFSGVPLPVHKPVVGTNSFAHEAGIHVAAVLRNPTTYETFPPETVGRKRRLSIGKHSGTTLVQSMIPQSSEPDLMRLTVKVKELQQKHGKRRLRRLAAIKQAMDRERSGVTVRQLRKLVVSR